MPIASTGPKKEKKVDFKAVKERGYGALGWDPGIGKLLKLTLKNLEATELVGKLLQKFYRYPLSVKSPPIMLTY